MHEMKSDEKISTVEPLYIEVAKSQKKFVTWKIRYIQKFKLALLSKKATDFSCQVIYSQFGLAIHQNDHQARRRFVEWAQNEIAVVPDFHKRILFSDEAHFRLNGYVNKQNCRIWSEGAVVATRPRTCHTARATIDLLKDTLGDRLISRFGPVNWPPRSCNLTPLNYFLWGYVKSLVYADKPQTLDHLEDNIRRVIADIRPQMLEKSSKIGRPDWTTSEPAMAVLCQKSYLKCNATRLSFE
ncbi:uncharacterized protein TNCV_1483921 [Trichonephila clavipes]|nr:uncharacterized protein TNCV_1483921 [Trichonephila clavipes]